jgi:hypothetical protein
MKSFKGGRQAGREDWVRFWAHTVFTSLFFSFSFLYNNIKYIKWEYDHVLMCRDLSKSEATILMI